MYEFFLPLSDCALTMMQQQQLHWTLNFSRSLSQGSFRDDHQ